MEDTGKGAVAEFIGTFALIFIGAGSIVAATQGGGNGLVAIALAHGLVLFIMISILGHISGGLFNPAIAVALWVTGKLTSTKTVVFIVAQVLGGVAGAYLLKFLVPAEMFTAAGGGTPAVMDGLAIGKAVLIEAVATFFLVLAVFGTAVDDRGPWNKTAGLTIGLTIAFDILAFGPFTGAAMNPARWLGPALATGHLDNWYVWIAGPLSGGIIAAVLYWGVFLRGKEPATP
ncbi:MAG: aquaporin [Actinomycetota bacterium]|nr:aquaporin [Actinomycetota bacterium]